MTPGDAASGPAAGHRRGLGPRRGHLVSGHRPLALSRDGSRVTRRLRRRHSRAVTTTRGEEEERAPGTVVRDPGCIELREAREQPPGTSGHRRHTEAAPSRRHQRVGVVCQSSTSSLRARHHRRGSRRLTSETYPPFVHSCMPHYRRRPRRRLRGGAVGRRWSPTRPGWTAMPARRSRRRATRPPAVTNRSAKAAAPRQASAHQHRTPAQRATPDRRPPYGARRGIRREPCRAQPACLAG